MSGLKKRVVAGRFTMVGGIALGLAYAIWLAYDHQSYPNDARLLVFFAVMVELPLAILVILPAQLLLGRIARASDPGRRLLLAALAAIPPATACVGTLVAQGTDWDEVMLVWIPMAPAIAVVGLFATGMLAQPEPNPPMGDEPPLATTGDVRSG